MARVGGREDERRPSLTGCVASGKSPNLSVPLFACQMANDTQFTCLAFPARLKGNEAGRGQCFVTEVLAQLILSQSCLWDSQHGDNIRAGTRSLPVRSEVQLCLFLAARFGQVL